MDKALTISGQADWTEWSTFRSLDIVFPALPASASPPEPLEERLGLPRRHQYKVNKGFAVRGGYYRQDRQRSSTQARSCRTTTGTPSREAG